MDSNDGKELNQLHLAYHDIGFKEGLHDGFWDSLPLISFTNCVISNYHNFTFHQHGLRCTGGSASPLARGLGFESWVWRKSCWERHHQMGPTVSDPNLVEVPMWALDTRWETKKKKQFPTYPAK